MESFSEVVTAFEEKTISSKKRKKEQVKRPKLESGSGDDEAVVSSDDESEDLSQCGLMTKLTKMTVSSLISMQ